MAIFTPLPEGFLSEMHQIEGLDAEALSAALDAAPSVGIRLNGRKPWSCSYSDATRVGWCEQGYYLPERPIFTLNPALHAGAFYVQDPSSMIHSELVKRIVAELKVENYKAPLALLDLCASPGGKTTAAIDVLPDDAIVVANEYEPSRVGALRENLIKWGFPNVAVTNGSTEAFKATKERFDIVMVDAPCSGEGMMRKEEQARRQWSAGLVEQCARTQRSILDDAYHALKPGGFLIYSTCTFNLSENEENVRFLIDEYGMVPIDMHLPKEWGIAGSADENPALRFMPHISRGEGLFAAVVRKPGNLSEYLSGGKVQNPKSAENLPGREFIRNPESYSFVLKGDSIFAVERNLAGIVKKLQGKTKIVMEGLEIGTMKGKSFIPAQALALSTALRRGSFPEVELTENQAISYLCRETFPLPESTPKGMILVSYLGLPLGWMKNLGNRANNLYPQAWRIRNANLCQQKG